MKWRQQFTIAVLMTAWAVFLVRPAAGELGKRSSFSLPLARLAVSFNDRTHVFEKVRVSFDDDNAPSKEYYYITPLDDQEIKETSSGRQKSIHMEEPDKAYIISDFEARILNEVCKSFISMLEIFEKDVHKEHWDRCLFIDAYFPRFLKGFYYLYCAARNSPYAMPKSSCIPDSLYDVSLTSQKSDDRVNMWRKNSDYLIKLRIASKEMIYQLKDWQKKELDNPSRNVEVPAGKKVEQAYALFVKVYFNLAPSPELPKEGEHL